MQTNITTVTINSTINSAVTEEGEEGGGCVSYSRGWGCCMVTG